MKRLGYERFVAQGGDWGAIITDVMATQGDPELMGIHTNMAIVIIEFDARVSVDADNWTCHKRQALRTCLINA